MSLDSIVEHILNQAKAEAENLIAQARKEAGGQIQDAKAEAETVYQSLLAKEKIVYEGQKQKLIVNARLESKKNVLLAKQELVDSVFDKVKVELHKSLPKKQKISREGSEEVSEDLDFYLKQLRPEHESQIAKTLFA